MIVTVTLNPSIDRTAPISGPLQRGHVNRLGSSTEVAAGKGVNISRVLHGAGIDTCAVVPAQTQDRLTVGLSHDGVPYLAVPIAAEVRVNLTITEPDGTTTKINQPGAYLNPQELVAIEDAVIERASGAQWVVLSGSVPPGVPTHWYATMTGRLHGAGVRVAVDTSDQPLQELAARLPGLAPDLIKPNSVELGQLCGIDGDSLESAAEQGRFDDIIDAARGLHGIGEVIVTLGGAGALLVTDHGAWHAWPEPIEVKSTVGAGDSSLAGFLLARTRGHQPEECLRAAVAWGTAAAALPGSTTPTPSQADAIHVSLAHL
ncbi:1-phosphofructokinase family hexose kinase [Cutibacterium sp. WCA-380-WT-3A]|uniref:1-phosphofructokinase family hexose kinase n=1 Tax=Cutibacterium porci TaxID=2605781 RepID=A0A7K0J4D8_9ACTN|nr:1-phosphofructokinase family hexose kinase [Cutibacterium porci]MSS44794.1 1-phosphofructokinase family hexose kinase [Cutibacterium porci]